VTRGGDRRDGVEEDGGWQGSAVGGGAKEDQWSADGGGGELRAASAR
jgi:hypothetical protein